MPLPSDLCLRINQILRTCRVYVYSVVGRIEMMPADLVHCFRVLSEAKGKGRIGAARRSCLPIMPPITISELRRITLGSHFN
jgi:hypothetical protein